MVVLRQHLDAEGFSRFAIKQYSNNARSFLRHVEGRGVRLESVRLNDVKRYLSDQRRRYRRRNGHPPADDTAWRSRFTAGIHMLLRLAQGEWPPPTPLESRVKRLREELRAEGLQPDTVRQYLESARLFLGFLERRGIEPERVAPEDIGAFISSRLKIYRKRYGRSPRRFVRWRCEFTKSIHRLLRMIQGVWPPPPPPRDATLTRLEEHLIQGGRNRGYVQVLSAHACRFLEYLKQQGLELASVQPADVAAYFRISLRLYRKRKPNMPNSMIHWRTMDARAVHGILRFAQREWPPGSTPPPILLRFKKHLAEQRYSPAVMISYVSAVRRFLRYLKEQNTPVEQVRPALIATFLETRLERYRQRHGHELKHIRQWRSDYTGPIHRFLRMLDPKWPPPEPPANERERFCREICEGYGRWLVELQGFSAATLRKNGDAAREFLRWLAGRSDRMSLQRLSVSDLDDYLAWRMPGLRRATRHGVANCLRSFLRYLYSAGAVPKDLSGAVSGPILYKFDEIPRAFSEEQVEALLHITRRDRTPIGLRDHAILLLLATYGLRAGEVVRLRLDDIDWRGERFRVRQSKTGVESFLPLVSPVSDALLDYLQHGRPESKAREVFLRAVAPYCPFPWGGSLYTIIDRRLREAGIEVKGRRGTHAFRFARARSLMRAQIPLKAIGDLLGHRSAESTQIYLRLVTDDLRAISLELPA
jgi:site-specific recombinase XerD